MTEKVTQAAPQIWEAIKKSNNILLHCHPGPDGDSVGGSLAFYHLLKSLGKNPTIIGGDSPIPLGLSKLPGADQIVAKNYFQINIADFDTFIILDSSSPQMISKKGEVVFPQDLQTIVIDHHSSNKGFGKINLIDDSYIATCQIIYELFEAWNIPVTSDMATCLMLGIYVDSGGFAYPKTTTETFQAAAKLAWINPDYTKALFELDNNNSPSKIYFQGLALSSIETFFSNKLALSAVSLARMKEKGIDPYNIEKSEIANSLKSVITWEIGVSLVEREENVVDLSLRTRDPQKYNLGKIAQSLGGGGHAAAAGATLNLPFQEAKKLLIDRLSALF